LTRSVLPGLAIATGVLIAGLLLAFTIGRYPVSLAELGHVLFAKIGGQRPDVSPAVESVILQVRGPRCSRRRLSVRRWPLREQRSRASFAIR
jgi:iron complex transport system permease protein